MRITPKSLFITVSGHMLPIYFKHFEEYQNMNDKQRNKQRCKSLLDQNIFFTDLNRHARKTWLNKISSDYPTPLEKAERIDLILAICLTLIMALFILALIFDL